LIRRGIALFWGSGVHRNEEYKGLNLSKMIFFGSSVLNVIMFV
jgi:hypothetical protein